MAQVDNGPLGVDRLNTPINEGDQIHHIRLGECGTVDCGQIVFPDGKTVDAAGYIKTHGDQIEILKSETFCKNDDSCICQNCSSC